MQEQQPIKKPQTDPNANQPYIGYIKDEDYYFDGYSHFSIHEEMLKDTIRTKSYMKSILNNPQIFKDKIVLDVGSGTGILSIFAVKSGAEHVFGIEKANIYSHSRKIIEENNFSDKITIINGLVEEIELPVDKVDIIISEWMGYFLLYESMFDSVLYARDKWLKKGGILLPNKAKMFIAALDDQAYYAKKLNYWNSVYGVSMKCMKKWVLSEPIIDPINKDDILSETVGFHEIDLEKVSLPQLDFDENFEIQIDTEGGFYGFVSWFDCDFSHGSKKITLSTSPYKKQTHWKQTVFYVDNPIDVIPKDKIVGRIKVTKAKENKRELNVKLEYRVNAGEKVVQFYRIS